MMIKGKLLVFVILSLFSFCMGCDTHKEVSQRELLAFVNKPGNNLVKIQEVNGIQVKLAYKPSSLLVLQELNGAQKHDTAVIRQLENKYNKQYYFILTFARNGKEVIRQLGNFGRYSDMLQVFAFDMQNHINLTTPEKDTVYLADYFFDQSYGMGGGNNILLSFDRSALAGRKTIDINIGECGLGIGNVHFQFNLREIEKTPALNYFLAN